MWEDVLVKLVEFIVEAKFRFVDFIAVCDAFELEFGLQVLIIFFGGSELYLGVKGSLRKQASSSMLVRDDVGLDEAIFS